MATIDCIIYSDTEKLTKSLSPSTNLDVVRTDLGNFMKAQDLFTYYDARQKLRLMQPKDGESDFDLGSILGENSVVTITDPTANKPDMEGDLVQWFTNRNVQANIVLNKTSDNADAISANEGKFQPFLLENVQTIASAGSDFPNVYFKYAVICEKGSAIKINISSWGAAGWAFSVKSDRDTIADGLYATNKGTATIKATFLDRYASAPQNIVVDSLSDQAIPVSDHLQYSYVTLNVWNVLSYKEDGILYSSNAQPPYNKSSDDPGGMQVKNGVVVPADGVESASPHADGDSTSVFSEGESGGYSDDRNQVLGEIKIYFLVFKDKESANQMIQQNNIPSF